MTEKLYYSDAYEGATKAVISSAGDGRRVVLDRTVFYPQGGGQLGDTGTIGGIAVLDTRLDQDSGEVVHFMAETVELPSGAEVDAAVDWDRRYALMKNHTLLHLIHTAFVSFYGDCRVRGSEVRPNKARVDYEYFEDISVDDLKQFVADVIAENKDVLTRPEVDSPYDGRREWVVDGLAPIPCGGTHVVRTGELGDFTIQAKRKGKQGVRIYGSATQ